MSITKQEITDWYMKTFSDKRLSFGCMYQKWRMWDRCFTYRITCFENTMSWDIIEWTSWLERKITKFEFINSHTIIWHPLTRWRLYALLKTYAINNQNTDIIDLWQKLVIVLFDTSLLDRDLYDRVEDEEVLKILISIKKIYE